MKQNSFLKMIKRLFVGFFFIPLASAFAVDPSFFVESNSTDGNTIFSDSSFSGYSISSIGSPTHSTDHAYCGNSSLLLESGDAISINAPSLAFGTGDFTIDFWMYPSFGGYDGSIFYDFTHAKESYPWNTYDRPQDNAWHHVAISKNSGTLRYFLDGVEKSFINEPSQSWDTSSGVFRFGTIDVNQVNDFQYFMQGYIDNLRIFKGTALYTQSFTPPVCNEYIQPTPTPSPTESTTPTPTPYNGDYDILLALQVGEGVISVDIVDALGDIVAIPRVLMSPISYKFDTQTTTGTMGTPQEKIRLSNPTGVSSWSVSIAATNGENATWIDDQGHTIPYNTATASLSINPTSGTITKVDGTGINGLSLGSNATFLQGDVSSITLFSANENAQAFSQYDLENVLIEQVIPAKQPSGNYEFNFTITAL